ncbi:MAG: hypothetical protein ACFBZ8_08960 [Opitutales bacterium]
MAASLLLGTTLTAQANFGHRSFGHSFGHSNFNRGVIGKPALGHRVYNRSPQYVHPGAFSKSFVFKHPGYKHGAVHHPKPVLKHKTPAYHAQTHGVQKKVIVKKHPHAYLGTGVVKKHHRTHFGHKRGFVLKKKLLRKRY